MLHPYDILNWPQLILSIWDYMVVGTTPIRHHYKEKSWSYGCLNVIKTIVDICLSDSQINETFGLNKKEEETYQLYIYWY